MVAVAQTIDLTPEIRMAQARSYDEWRAAAARKVGVAHDRMHGGIKGRRKSKKDKPREAQGADQDAQQ